VSFSNGHTCQIEGIGTLRIKLFDGMIRELKDVRYVPQLQKNLISIGTLEAQGLRETLGEGVFKMFSDSLVVLKCIRCNNLYYLKGSTVTGNLTASEHLEDDSTRLWHMRFGHTGEKSLQVLTKQGSVKGAFICNLELGGQDVLNKKTKVKFGTTTHRSEGLFHCAHVDIWVLPRLHRLEAISTIPFIDDISRRCWVYPMKIRFKILDMLVK